MSGPKLSDPWTEHPALVKAEAGREIARLRIFIAELVEWIVLADNRLETDCQQCVKVARTYLQAAIDRAKEEDK